MAELERIALLIEQGLLHGVKLAGGRDGTPVVTAGAWPLENPAAPPADTATEPAMPAEAPAALPGDDAFCQARTALKIDAGCALALPTDDLILRVLVLPPTDAENLAPIIRLQMEKIAPCSGEALSVGFEVLALEEAGVRVFAAAIPQEALDVWARRIADAGLRLTRIDAALLGWWRQLVDLGGTDLQAGHTAVLLEQGGRWDFILSERGEIRLARGFGVPGEAADLGRELMLTLLNHEMETGACRIDKLLVVAAVQPAAAWMDALVAAVGSGLQPRWIDRAELGQPALGNARREGETGGLDLIPDAWRRQESSRLSRRRFLAWIGAAAGLWIVLAALLLAAPAVVRRQTAAVNARIASGEPAYRAVAEIRQRVRLIRSYMDRSQSLLEILREVCTVMPDGMEFGSITYRRGDAVKLVGDADQSARIYALKDALDAADRYESTRLNGPTLDAARRRYRFEIDARFKGGGE